MLHSQACDGPIFRIKIWPRNGANCRSSTFSKECCPNAMRRRQAVLCILRRKRVGKLKDPCDACGRFGGEPAMVNSDQQTRLSGRKRGCRPLERSVVGDLSDLPSEP